MADEWVEWSPQYVPHVRGRFTRRVFDPSTREFEEQKVEARCSVCGEDWQGRCSSGRTREKIATFAGMHLHERR